MQIRLADQRRAAKAVCKQPIRFIRRNKQANVRNSAGWLAAIFFKQISGFTGAALKRLVAKAVNNFIIIKIAFEQGIELRVKSVAIIFAVKKGQKLRKMKHITGNMAVLRAHICNCVLANLHIRIGDVFFLYHFRREKTRGFVVLEQRNGSEIIFIGHAFPNRIAQRQCHDCVKLLLLPEIPFGHIHLSRQITGKINRIPFYPLIPISKRIARNIPHAVGQHNAFEWL